MERQNMAEIRANQVMAILQASGELPPEFLEKISNLVLTDPNIPLLENLIHSKVLTTECVQNIQSLIQMLRQQFRQTSDVQQQIALQNLDKISSITLSDEMKKDILFARQVLAEGTCKVEDVNRCFEEQASIRRSSNKTLLIGQIMVRNHYIAVERFIQIHREIEQQAKNTDWSKIFVGERRVRLTFQGGVIRFVEGNIPQKFGPYQVLAEIARGGMGVVYKAWDDKLRRTVALKVLKDWENPPQDEIQRFNREARLAASLHHANIVSIYDSGIAEGVHYFTMDFVEGQTLSAYLKANHRNFQQEITIIREIALALHYAHSHGIIHRDVKPANIILDKNNVPMLTDFGLAKGINQFDSKRLTKSGEALGTPAYMSPEQKHNSDQIDGRSDIYSLGAVLYEILVGEPPDTNTTNIIPSTPSSRNPKIHRDIETICMKALAYQPQERYKTAKEFADDLDRFLYGQHIKAKPISGWDRITQRLQNHINLVIPILLLLIGGLISIVFLGVRVYYSFQIAEQNYQKALEMINSNQNDDAIQYFDAASKHPQIYDKVYAKRQELSQLEYEQSKTLLENYRIEKPKLSALYEKELRRFNISSDFANKKAALKSIQNLRMLQHKNFRQIAFAYQQASQGLVWQSNHPKLWTLLDELQQEAYYEQNPSAQFWLPLLQISEKNTSTIHITTEPEHAQVYIFAWGELYLRQVPVPYFLADKFLFAGELIPEMEQDYLETTRPNLANPSLNINSKSANNQESIALSSRSYATETPGNITVKYPGYYLIVVVKEGYQEVRHIIKVVQGEQYKLQIKLVPNQIELQEYFSVNLPSTSDMTYVSNEITCSQYQRFLQSPEILSKYQSLAQRGILRYIPRVANNALWIWNGQQFIIPDTNMPVIGISGQDAQEYCQWASNISPSKIRYRLLTAEEWQWVAGKVIGLQYPWGQNFDSWFFATQDKKTGFNFDVSPYGLSSMAGGVSEWCNDEYKTSSSGTSVLMAVVCGGVSKSLNSSTARTNYMEYRNASSTSDTIGFRVMAILGSEKK